VVKIPLEWGQVSPDEPDREDKTPLLHAVSHGHEGVVKILLEREEVNPNRWDNNCWTPLAFAASKGHEAVGKVLLEQEEVNPDMPDNCQIPVAVVRLSRKVVISRTIQGTTVWKWPPHSPFPVCVPWWLWLDITFYIRRKSPEMTIAIYTIPS